jgi:hypothetical protein
LLCARELKNEQANMKTTKRIDLMEKHTGGLHLGIKYYADGKQISQKEFQSIKSDAARLECMSNSQTNGVWTFYTTAVLN